MEAFSDDLQDVENMAQCPAIRSQKSEVGGQRSEVRSQRSFRHSSFVIRQFGFPIALRIERRYFWRGLSGGVMVAQESLELFVMVRIHAGQPTANRAPQISRDGVFT